MLKIEMDISSFIVNKLDRVEQFHLKLWDIIKKLYVVYELIRSNFFDFLSLIIYTKWLKRFYSR